MRLKDKGILLLSTVWGAINYLLVWIFSSMTYMTADDGYIHDIIAGNISGTPYWSSYYVNILITAPLSLLYRLCSGVQWWFVWSQFCMLLGIVIIHKNILKIAIKERWLLFLSVVIIQSIDILFFAYFLSRTAFTIVPAILGVAAITEILVSFSKNEKQTLRRALILFVIACCHRNDTGYVILCFLLLALLGVYLFEHDKISAWIKRYVLYSLIFVIVALGLSGLNGVFQRAINGEVNIEFDQLRSAYTDYPNETYAEDTERYQQVGWDENDYNLISMGCLMIDECTTETLTIIVAGSELRNDVRYRIMNTINTIYSPLCKPLIIVWFGTGVCFGLFWIIRHRFKYFLIALFNNVGAGILLAYQLYIGRMLHRTLIIVIIPVCIINIYLCIRLYEEKIWYRIVGTIAVLCLCVGAVKYAPLAYSKDEYLLEISESTRVVREYVGENQDKIYVAPTGMIRPFNVTTTYENKPYNLISWGAWYYKSGVFQKQLEQNGLDNLDGSLFERDNVFLLAKIDVTDPSYIIPENGDSITCFYMWLKEHYNVVGFKLEDTISPEAYAYKFIYDEEEDHYTIENGVVKLVQKEK